MALPGAGSARPGRRDGDGGGEANGYILKLGWGTLPQKNCYFLRLSSIGNLKIEPFSAFRGDWKTLDTPLGGEHSLGDYCPGGPT